MIDPPSPFVLSWLSRLRNELPPGALALDVAMGSGRHALLLAEYGFRTVGLDIDPARVRAAAQLARQRHLQLGACVADLSHFPIPSRRFGVVLISRYLDRGLMPSLRESVRPGGFILYETFTVEQCRYPTGPRNPDHLLQSGELRGFFKGWEILLDEETSSPAALARLVGRRIGENPGRTNDE